LLRPEGEGEGESVAEIGVDSSYPLTSAGASGLAAISELAGAANERTLEILKQRHVARRPHRRGWLVRRMLLLADVLGLALSFLVVELLFGADGGSVNPLHPVAEYALLLASLPLWVVLARLYGLYDQDEERTHHPTTDDVLGVFHLVTVGSWLLLAAGWVTGLADPNVPKLMTL
jgi:hypothetical protein